MKLRAHRKKKETTLPSWGMSASSASSERGDSNARPLRPERSALPTALLSDFVSVCKGTASRTNSQIFCTFFSLRPLCRHIFGFFCDFFRKSLAGSKKRRTFATAFTRCTLGAIAQLVEHRTENPCVPGSNPGGTTKKKARAFFFRIRKTPYAEKHTAKSTAARNIAVSLRVE